MEMQKHRAGQMGEKEKPADEKNRNRHEDEKRGVKRRQEENKGPGREYVPLL